jgi:hypothetical protein
VAGHLVPRLALALQDKDFVDVLRRNVGLFLHAAVAGEDFHGRESAVEIDADGIAVALENHGVARLLRCGAVNLAQFGEIVPDVGTGGIQDGDEKESKREKASSTSHHDFIPKRVQAAQLFWRKADGHRKGAPLLCTPKSFVMRSSLSKVIGEPQHPRRDNGFEVQNWFYASLFPLLFGNGYFGLLIVINDKISFFWINRETRVIQVYLVDGSLIDGDRVEGS